MVARGSIEIKVMKYERTPDLYYTISKVRYTRAMGGYSRNSTGSYITNDKHFRIKFPKWYTRMTNAEKDSFKRSNSAFWNTICGLHDNNHFFIPKRIISQKLKEYIPYSEDFAKPNAAKGGAMRFVYAISKKENIEGLIDMNGNVNTTKFNNSGYYKIMDARQDIPPSFCGTAIMSCSPCVNNNMCVCPNDRTSNNSMASALQNLPPTPDPCPASKKKKCKCPSCKISTLSKVMMFVMILIILAGIYFMYKWKDQMAPLLEESFEPVSPRPAAGPVMAS